MIEGESELAVLGVRATAAAALRLQHGRRQPAIQHLVGGADAGCARADHQHIDVLAAAPLDQLRDLDAGHLAGLDPAYVFARERAQVSALDEDLSSLEALNRRLWSWVEAEYHHSPHRGLDDETPLDRWAQIGDQVRYADDLDLDDLFLFEAKRKVRKDRTVSLDGIDYEVEASLVDEKVTLRFDPKNRTTVQVVFEGRRFGDAKPVDVHANCFVKREKSDKAGVKLSELVADHEEER